MMEESVVLEAIRISKKFGATQALKNASFRVNRGEVHGLVGENGAGKSTLMKIFSGVYSPDSGTINIEGENILHLGIKDRQERGLSMVYQEINIFPNLSIARNVFASREPLGRIGLIDEKRMVEDTRRLISQLNVDLKPEAIVNSLSTAEKQLTQLLWQNHLE